MLIGANSKLWVALLGIAFLLFNPAGFCTDDMTASAKGHPCCPKAPATAKASCLCIDRTTVAPSVPAPAESVAPVAIAVESPLPMIELAPATDSVEFSPPERFLAFHQLLV
jgi:hypothetical protein